jgi:hypothetical protein
MSPTELTAIADKTAAILSEVDGMHDVVSLIKLLSITVKEHVEELKSCKSQNEINHDRAEAIKLARENHIKRIQAELEALPLHKCGECIYVKHCPWTRGEDDGQCAKFEHVENHKHLLEERK